MPKKVEVVIPEATEDDIRAERWEDMKEGLDPDDFGYHMGWKAALRWARANVKVVETVVNGRTVFQLKP